MRRNSNIEALRILCMLMIVGGHVMINHKTVFSLTDIDEIIDLFFKGAFCVAVNAFVLISGYFGIQFKKDRLAHLIIQTFFYSVTFMILAIILGWHTLNLRTDIFAFLPILTKQYWFVTCYVVLYVISPWLNIWVNGLERPIYRKFLIIGFFIVYVWPTFNYMINAPQFISDAGYGIVNFVYLYMFGRYLHIHFEKRHSPILYWGGYVLTAILLFLCQYSISWLLGFEFTSWKSYNSLFCFVGSICLFMTFKELSFYSSIVNYWAKPCLAVYLIHMAPYIWDRFCFTIGVREYHGLSYLLLIFTLPILVYFLCAIIEIGRMRILAGIENRAISHILG